MIISVVAILAMVALMFGKLELVMRENPEFIEHQEVFISIIDYLTTKDAVV